MKSILLFIGLLLGQVPATRSLLGTVTAIRMEAGEIEVRPDSSPIALAKLSGATIVQRIAPGETNLRNAATIKISDVSVGDRVLVTLPANSPDALRIIVMSASDIARHDQAERDDWNRRGVNGIVAAKNGSQITLRARTLQGEAQQTVVVTEKTSFRRYAPDSVRFADAAPSKLDDVSVGDQLRARGEKSPDGLKVQADEVVFGTFVTRAGAVTSVDAAAKQVVLVELGTGKRLTVKVSPDSQIKQLTAPPRGAVPPSMNEMIEGMPSGKIEDIKPGTSLIVSSTKGSQGDQVTAILVLANADMLIRQLAALQGRGSGTLTFGAAGGPGGLDALGVGF